MTATPKPLTKDLLYMLLFGLLAILGLFLYRPPTSSTFTFLGYPQDTHKPIAVYGFAGVRGLVPENSLPGFEVALDMGVTTLDITLQLTKDHQPVVWHDSAMGGERCKLTHHQAPAGLTAPQGVWLAEWTLADLQLYECSRNPNDAAFPNQVALTTPLAGNDYQLLTLGELLSFINHYAQAPEKTPAQRSHARQIQLAIWVDSLSVDQFEKLVWPELVRRNLTGRIILQSTKLAHLQQLHTFAPQLQLAWRTSTAAPNLAEAQAAGVTIWKPLATTVTPALVTEAHTAGLKVVPWVVNEPAEMTHFLEMGVDGLSSDRPDLLLRLLASQIK